MQVTAHFVIWTIVLETLIGFGLAYLIDRKFRGHGFWTTVILIPMMLSPAVVGNFWKFLYQPQIGLFNYAVSFFTGIRSDVVPDARRGHAGALGDRHRRRLDVDALRDADLPRRACARSPTTSTRRPRSTAPRNWRQFWSITLPMALPFIMLAVLFRGIENFKMFDMVNLLTGGGPGSTTEVASITLKREAFEKLADRLFLGLRHHPVRHRLRPGQHLREGAQPGEAAMSAVARTAAHSVVEPTGADAKRIAGALVIVYALITMVPLLWIVATSFKTPPDSIAYPPKVLFQPSLEGYVQSVHHAHAADAGIHRQPAAGDRAGTTSSCARATW